MYPYRLLPVCIYHQIDHSILSMPVRHMITVWLSVKSKVGCCDVNDISFLFPISLGVLHFMILQIIKTYAFLKEELFHLYSSLIILLFSLFLNPSHFIQGMAMRTCSWPKPMKGMGVLSHNNIKEVLALSNVPPQIIIKKETCKNLYVFFFLLNTQCYYWEISIIQPSWFKQLKKILINIQTEKTMSFKI